MTTDWHAQAEGAPIEASAMEAGTIALVSRLAGPAMLLTAYVAVMAWWF